MDYNDIMLWIILAVLAPLLYSFTNYFQKYLIDKKIKHPLNIIILGGFFSLIVSISIFLYKGSISASSGHPLLLVLAGIFALLYLIPYFKALSLDDASRVAPLFQFTPIIVLVLSRIFLHEQLVTTQIIAFFCILLGGFILGIEKDTSGVFKPRKSFWFMMLSCTFDGIIGILFKYAQVQNDYWLSLAYLELGVGIAASCSLLLPTVRRDFLIEIPKIKHTTWGLLLSNKIIDFSAGLSMLYAMLLAPVALVTVINGIQPLFLLLEGLILTAWFPHIIKEDTDKKTVLVKLLSVGLFFSGIFLLSK